MSSSLITWPGGGAPDSSDHPLLDIGRCVGDLEGLDLAPEVLDAYAYGNAQRVFFGAQMLARGPNRS